MGNFIHNASPIAHYSLPIASAFIGVYLRLIAVVALVLAAGVASAQNYPVKPIRIVVPYPPGGGTDVVARTLAHKMNEMLGQPAVVDNRAGANGRTRAVNRVPACGM